MPKKTVNFTISFACEIDPDDIENGLTEPSDILEDIASELEYTWLQDRCPLPYNYELCGTDMANTKKFGTMRIQEVP
jgi:hypothetical protein